MRRTIRLKVKGERRKGAERLIAVESFIVIATRNHYSLFTNQLMNILTLIIFTPLLFAFIIAVLPSAWRNSFKCLTLAATLVQLGMSIWMYCHFKTGADFAGINHEGQFQFMQKLPWINLDLGAMGKMQIDYFVGIDGISVTLLVMTSFVNIAALACGDVKRLKGFFVLFLILDMAVTGVFCSLDFFLFYILRINVASAMFLVGMGWRKAGICGYKIFPVYFIRVCLYVAGDRSLSIGKGPYALIAFNMIQMMNRQTISRDRYYAVLIIKLLRFSAGQLVSLCCLLLLL